MKNFCVRRVFLISVFLLLLSKISFSQRFKAGITGGFTTSQVSGDQLAGFNKSGFEFGGLVSSKLSQKFDLSFQIVFIQKGSKRPFNPDQGDFDYYKMSLNYIEVPVLFHYNFSKRFQFAAGPAFGTLISSKEEDESGTLIYSKPFKKYDLSVQLGISYMLFNNFYLNLEGSNSLLPIRNAGIEGGFKVGRDQFNSVLMFSFKYIFHKKAAEPQ